MTKFFTICFLLMPWVMIPNDKLADPFRLPKAAFFDFICIGLICFSFYKGLHKRYLNKYLSWLVIWIFCIIGINWYLPYTLSFNNQQAINLWILEPMLHIILTLWASYIALSSFEKEDFDRIAKTICWSAVLISSVGILQVLGLDIFGKIARYQHQNKFCAFLDNPNVAGNYLALSLPFFLNKQKKYIIGFILIIIGLIFSKSEFSMIVACIGLFTYLLLTLRQNKRIFWSLVSISSLIIVGIGFKLQYLLSHFGSRRFELWKLAWVHFKENPVFGQGLGIVKTWELQIINVGNIWLNLHSDWFEMAVQIGILGIVLVLLVIINCLRKFNYKTDDKIGYVYYASFISFLVLMFGSFPLEVAPLALFGLTNWWAVEIL